MEMIMKNNYHPEEEEDEDWLELTLSIDHEANRKRRTVDVPICRNKRRRKTKEERLWPRLRLNLYDYPWDITKKLTKSDVGKLSRLLLDTELVEANILCKWDAHKIAEAKTPRGTQVNIYDQDTDSYHELTFRRWSSSNSYILNNNWNKEFVTRRDLKEGDEIGLFWIDSYFSFLLMERA